MKVPWYETSPGATAALLQTRAFVDVDIYTFTLIGEMNGGQPLYYSGGPFPVSINGTTWPVTILVDKPESRAVGHWKIGLDVDVWQVDMVPRLVNPITGAAFPDMIGNQPWLNAVQQGALQGAICQITRCFAPVWPGFNPGIFKPTGAVTMLYGRVAEIDVGRSQANITVKDFRNSLKNPLPRNFFQPSCVHTLFDQGCTLLAASFAEEGVIIANNGSAVTATVATPGGSGTYALGRIEMTSGASEGYKRTVRSWSQGTPAVFNLLSPFPAGVAAGDTFTAYPGCNKLYGTCAVFQNTKNFGGCLSIPLPELAV